MPSTRRRPKASCKNGRGETHLHCKRLCGGVRQGREVQAPFTALDHPREVVHDPAAGWQRADLRVVGDLSVLGRQVVQALQLDPPLALRLLEGQDLPPVVSVEDQLEGAPAKPRNCQQEHRRGHLMLRTLHPLRLYLPADASDTVCIWALCHHHLTLLSHDPLVPGGALRVAARTGPSAADLVAAGGGGSAPRRVRPMQGRAQSLAFILPTRTATGATA
mmetsp:Transcript_40118/g.125042  ORF Transcript_40118/g.125042 Transcript_40118/m.125042 type:complete len:219 (+) Transcript_40118:181-837(+)